MCELKEHNFWLTMFRLFLPVLLRGSTENEECSLVQQCAWIWIVSGNINTWSFIWGGSGGGLSGSSCSAWTVPFEGGVTVATCYRNYRRRIVGVPGAEWRYATERPDYFERERHQQHCSGFGTLLHVCINGTLHLHHWDKQVLEIKYYSCICN